MACELSDARYQMIFSSAKSKRKINEVLVEASWLSPRGLYLRIVLMHQICQAAFVDDHAVHVGVNLGFWPFWSTNSLNVLLHLSLAVFDELWPN